MYNSLIHFEKKGLMKKVWESEEQLVKSFHTFLYFMYNHIMITKKA